MKKRASRRKRPMLSCYKEQQPTLTNEKSIIEHILAQISHWLASTFACDTCIVSNSFFMLGIMLLLLLFFVLSLFNYVCRLRNIHLALCIDSLAQRVRFHFFAYCLFCFFGIKYYYYGFFVIISTTTTKNYPVAKRNNHTNSQQTHNSIQRISSSVIKQNGKSSKSGQNHLIVQSFLSAIFATHSAPSPISVSFSLYLLEVCVCECIFTILLVSFQK